MYKSILVATDGSELGKLAVTQAAALAAAFAAKLTVLTVTLQATSYDATGLGFPLPQSVFDDIRKANDEQSRTILSDAVAGLAYEAKTVTIEAGTAAEGIVDTVRSLGCDLVVMGSHGHRGLDRLILGSQAAKVLTLSPVPVLIVKQAP